MITHYPLKWWLEQLKKPMALARFGDGEFLCIEGKQGGNSHGCAYTPQLKADLVAILEETSTNFLKGMQRILPSQYARIRPLLTGTWVDTELFSDLMALGEMRPFFEALRERRIVIVSSIEKQKQGIFPDAEYVVTPLTNAHADKERIVRECLELSQPGTVFLFACGMAAGTFVHALYGKAAGATLLDIGHILDPFIGDNSREYLKDVPPEILKQNLPCNE